MRELNANQLKAYLDVAKPRPRLVDVREPWEYRHARIPESTLMPMRSVPQRLQELDPAAEIVVICHHGVRSRHVAAFLEAHGFLNVINLSDGIDAWSRDVDSSIPMY